MNILIITGVRINLGGGMEYFIKDIIDHLGKRHHITIVEAEFGPEHTNLKEKINGADILSLGNRSGFDIPSLSEFLKLRRLFLRNDVVYYLSGAWNEIYCIILQFLTGTPVIGLSWFLSDIEFRFGKYRKREGNSARARLGTFFFGPSLIRLGKFFRMYQVVSHKDYLYLTKRWKDSGKVREIPFGIDIARYKPCKKRERFTLLYLARLDFQKGADLIPTIYAGIKNKIENFKLIIVGDGKLKGILEEFARDKPEIELRSYIGKESNWGEYSLLMCSAHLLLSPLRYAGTTFTSIEAMAFGTPVIEFDVTGTRERINNGIDGFVVNDEREMIDRIISVYKMWNDSNTYDAFSESALKKAAEFNVKERMDDIEAMFYDVVQSVNKL